MNDKIALALKYRPTTFDELVGQKSVSSTLSRACATEHLLHAYLFSGLRGSGKTSTARIFARTLQCESPKNGNPCNQCDSCKASLAGTHMDIIELDAASSRKIDDIREIIEGTKYTPSMGRFKIYIIDEVHMLTKEAFNALLKTLEEPPSFVKFILATTDPLKLPATILSRTQHFRFKNIPFDLVVEHLKHILEIENIKAQDEAINIIARSGGGSLRDTLTLLDQSIIYCSDDQLITLEKISDMLGVVNPSILDEYFANIRDNNKAAVLEKVEFLSAYECDTILEEMSLRLQDYLKNDNFSVLLIDRFLHILSDAKGLLFLNANPSFVLTITALKMLEATKLLKIEDAIDAVLSDSPISPIAAIASTTTAPADAILSAELTTSELPKANNLDVLIYKFIEKNEKISNNAKKLVDALLKRDMMAATIMLKSISFIKIEDEILYWNSNKDLLNDDEIQYFRAHYPLIKEYVSENLMVKDIKASALKIDEMQSAQIYEEIMIQDEVIEEYMAPVVPQKELSGKEILEKFKLENKEFMQDLESNFSVVDVQIGLKND